MRDTWRHRLQRAEHLAADGSASVPLVAFYAALLRVQEDLYNTLSALPNWRPSGALDHDLPAFRRQLPAVLRAILQPYAQWLAERGAAPVGRGLPRADNRCPFCAGTPQLSMFRGASDSALEGGGRALQCATCFTTWPFRRVVCTHCGEEDERRLGYFQSPAFEHLRVEACDTCGHYLKGIDLTRLGVAVPIVDEVAGAPLDAWAREHGYEKIELNLVGL